MVTGILNSSICLLLIRRRRNRIEQLKGEDGAWIEDAGATRALAVRYFTHLFSQAQTVQNDIILPNLFPNIAPMDIGSLNINIELVDVKESLFNIGSIKAPGVDGFLASFFQNQWHVYANDIFAMVCRVFEECKVPEGLNDTLITLVPKVERPISMA
ncbi:hypothetical protein L3X38_004496 [Prunus dulcis]|uniref:Uncharacterized protein n=1 Tax=Prunus dulcis TaxID=3755 RepID=A0AAD5F3B1_PRUDU|nr:hypothetical protein L3X38_004496 [Prunus dulcis]